jgi:hypothetical protein
MFRWTRERPRLRSAASLALVRNDETTADPIVNDPKADTISVADLADIERVVGGRGAGIRCLYRSHLLIR